MLAWLLMASIIYGPVHAGAGESAAATSEAGSFMPVPAIPAAPSGLTATAVSSSRIDLAWADNSGDETGFKIERKTGAAGTYVQITTVGANVTSFSNISGLSPNTQYFYRVRANNASGNSAFSNEANATTLAGPPTAPSGLAATAMSSSRIDLAWTDNSGDEDGFKIERKTGAAGSYVQITKVGANVTSFSNISGLSPNTEYFYRVRAYSANGNSAFSNEANATTLAGPPTAPSGLAATAMSSSRIDLAWTDNSNNEDGFKIERRLSSTATYTEIATVGANVTSFSSTGLSPNTGYTYRVRASNISGNSAYSNEASATTLRTPPAKPSNLTAAAVSSSQIDLEWTDNSGNEDGFKIERKTGAAGTYAEIATVGANVKSFSNTGLSAGTQYFYRVRAFNNGGNSGYSNEANATTLPTAPTAPSSLTATTVSNTQIDLAWADNSGNEDGFKIERKTGAAGTYAEVGTVGANVASYSDNGLDPATEYFYRVRAHNAGGQSDYSNEANATTLPTAPTAPSSLTATTVSNTQIDLAWADNSGNEDGFKIERKTGAAGTYAEVGTVGANVASYSDNGLDPATEYFYRVRAYNTSGNSAYSNEANATTFSSNVNLALNKPATASSTDISSTPSLAVDGNSLTFWRSGFVNSTNAIQWLQVELHPSLPVTIGRAVVTWSQSYFALQYEFQVSTDGTAWTAVYTNNAGASGTQDFAFTTTSARFVRLYMTKNEKSNYRVAELEVYSGVPVAPNSLMATPISQSQINLAWADNSSDEVGFKIERKTGAAGTYAEVATVGTNMTSYSNTGLDQSTEYFYRVRGYNTFGNSSYSNEASATTLPIPPAAPDSLTAATVSHAQIDLAWTDHAGNEDGFKIERKTGAAGTYAEIASVGANVTSYSNIGLDQTTEYFYRVRSHNAGGHSDYSNEANATTLSAPPAAPSNLSAATINQTQIDLAWTDNADNEAGFKIERKAGAAGTYAEIATAGANVTNYSDTGLDQATEYFYRVRAYHGGNHSAYSNEANATTLLNAPKAPGNLTTTAVSQTKVNLAWADSSSNEDGFKIERKTPQGGAGTYAQVATVGANVTAYSDSNLTASTVYFYRVRASNTGGNSGYSNEADATTLPNPPTAPSSLTATVSGSTQINLAWTDNANNETGFKIEQKVGAAGAYAEIATAGANVTSYANTGLTTGVTYSYRVRAFNTGGNSAYSNEASGTPSSDANFALNKPTTASSTDTSSAPGKATDGNTLTYWRSGAVNSGNAIQWLQVELHPSLPITIGRAVVIWFQTYFANQLEIQVSTDGTNWTAVYTNDAITTNTTLDVTFPAVAAKYVRLYCKKNNKSNYRVTEFEIYGSTSKTVSQNAEHETLVPDKFSLEQNYPNPFNPSTHIAFSVKEAGVVQLSVYNLQGQEVRTLVAGHTNAGRHTLIWNGRDNAGNVVPSGTYLYKLRVNGFEETKKMTLMK
jgi:titin